jgi:hypothetical protein
MKTKIPILILLLSAVMTTGFSQEKTKKELKEEKKLENQKRIESLISAKEFTFAPRTALPSGMKSVNISTNNNFVKFQPDLVESNMPFFGRGYGASGYGSDAGLKFKGKPETFTVEKKAKTFIIEVSVKGETDYFKLLLSVGFEGNASLSITSYNRSTMSFDGEITATEKPEKKQ